MTTTAVEPVDWRCVQGTDLMPSVGLSMTNLDHSIEEGLEGAIADGKHMAHYPGMNFFACVFRDVERELYVADVHVYHIHRGFVSAPSLKELMDAVSEEFGWD